jgi:MFS family permease
MIIVHLVNYATDMGIPQLVAASFISAIGAISIAGRISMGIGTDKIGIYNTLILTRILLMVSLIFLIFTRSLWAFYIFALLFGLSYGGEIPQIPLFIGKYWGTKALATLVGFSMFVISLGGALGPWIAGKIYDSTQSYEVAFIIGIVASLASLVLVLVLKSRKRATD